MSKRAKLLSQEQLQFIRDNWGTMTDRDLAKCLDVSITVLKNRRRKMGLFKNATTTPYARTKRYMEHWQRQLAKIVSTRPCPRVACDGVAERSELVLLCRTCSQTWMLPDLKTEKRLARFQQGSTFTYKSIGTNRSYEVKKLEKGKSLMRVYFSQSPIDMIWEDFLDMFTLHI